MEAAYLKSRPISPTAAACAIFFSTKAKEDSVSFSLIESAFPGCSPKAQCTAENFSDSARFFLKDLAPVAFESMRETPLSEALDTFFAGFLNQSRWQCESANKVTPF